MLMDWPSEALGRLSASFLLAKGLWHTKVHACLVWVFVSTHTYFLGQGYLIGWKIKPGSGRRGHSKIETATILLRAIRLSIPLSEAEYSGNFQDQYDCSCQDTVTVTFASDAGCTDQRLGPIVLARSPAAALTSRKHTEKHKVAWRLR